jgi:hypothetical protein
MTRHNTVPPSLPSPPKPAVAYSDRNKDKDKPPPGEDQAGTKTTRWLLENSLQRRVAIAEHRVAVMDAEATRLRKGLHLSVASAAAGTARAAEAAYAVHAASVKEAEEAASREKEAAAAKRAESVRRKVSIEQRRRANLAAKGLDDPAPGSVEEMWVQMEEREPNAGHGQHKSKHGKHHKKKQAAGAEGDGQSQLSLAAAFLGFDPASEVAARTGSRRGRRREDKDRDTLRQAIDGAGPGAGGSGRESAPPKLPGAEQETRSVVLPAL